MQELQPIRGYACENARSGSRNRLLVLPSFICSSVVFERIAEEKDDAVALPHAHGCSQVGKDSERTFRILKGFAEDSNVGAVMVVSHGCEVVDAEQLQDILRNSESQWNMSVFNRSGVLFTHLKLEQRLLRNFVLNLKSLNEVKVA
ncbi:UxaA family hydrolase [Alicyclobacillus fastidiosus]|uniref:UxaA family hydrolase n=1 Tax=Alicyclobacillus fastidiosus TaxID=392011 RepID=A0ABY6ZNH3_9BACL|nr:UxaA family hydrolase [Alicyclobacillus fastidiosus]WAH44394.1 UxaA family hydrolase [Alicyclobacillus fastidiosus]